MVSCNTMRRHTTLAHHFGVTDLEQLDQHVQEGMRSGHAVDYYLCTSWFNTNASESALNTSRCCMQTLRAAIRRLTPSESPSFAGSILWIANRTVAGVKSGSPGHCMAIRRCCDILQALECCYFQKSRIAYTLEKVDVQKSL
jgi:hypothetical protein